MMTEKYSNIHVTEKVESRRTGHDKTWQVCQIEGRDQRRWRRGEGLREIKQALFGLQGAEIMDVISHQNHLKRQNHGSCIERMINNQNDKLTRR